MKDAGYVTITNLTVRLRRLGLIYLRDGDRTIYRSNDEVTDQRRLFRTFEDSIPG